MKVSIQKDNVVCLPTSTIEMKVTAIKYHEDTGEKRLLCTWTSPEGESHERWFFEPQVTFVREA